MTYNPLTRRYRLGQRLRRELPAALRRVTPSRRGPLRSRRHARRHRARPRRARSTACAPSRAYEPLPLERLRPFASAGARGLVHAGFGVKPGDAEYEALREAFLDFYDERVCVRDAALPRHRRAAATSSPRAASRWGIVTNKATRFTDAHRRRAEARARLRRLRRLDAAPQAASRVRCCTPRSSSSCAPADCCYLGDDLRDMQAARAAGMRPIAVDWGYHHPDNGGARHLGRRGGHRSPIPWIPAGRHL